MKQPSTKSLFKRLWPSPRKRSCLVMKESDWKAIRDHVLQSDGHERMALGLLGHARCEEVRELYLHRLELPADDDYVTHHATLVELKPERGLKSFSSFVNSDATGYLHVHSHPFCEWAHFSHIDNEYHHQACKRLRAICPSGAGCGRKR